MPHVPWVIVEAVDVEYMVVVEVVAPAVAVDNRHLVGDNNFPGMDVAFHVMNTEYLVVRSKFEALQSAIPPPAADTELLGMNCEQDN